jgi:2-polyprenyl-3-methyl-5-hydroxy-6-metoxy-1,4-benzoquinol methylase
MGNYESHRLRMLSRLVRGSSVLDLGCAAMPNRRLRARRVVAFDLRPVEPMPPYTESVMGDVNHLDDLLPGQRFDTILMGELVEHLERPYDVLRSLRKHLTADGRLILSTPNPLGLPVVVAEYLRLRRFFYTQEHTYYFPPRWVWRLLEGSGYRVLQTIGAGFPLAGWWAPAPVSLSYHVLYVAVRA